MWFLSEDLGLGTRAEGMAGQVLASSPLGPWTSGVMASCRRTMGIPVAGPSFLRTQHTPRLGVSPLGLLPNSLSLGLSQTSSKEVSYLVPRIGDVDHQEGDLGAQEKHCAGTM